jgi:1-acyl-sn-glycerol-3-phosphate acyltransferase
LFVLKLLGWKIVGSLPENIKYLVVVAPHTSNWDLVIGLFGRFAVGVRICFLAKKQVFFFPLGILLRAVGGIAIDRSKSNNTVETVASLFKDKEQLALAITPEGTRSPVTRWKEGFYHIACKAKVPIVMIGIDYGTKEIKIIAPFIPSGDITQDFPIFLQFFRTIKGRYPKEIPDYQPREP